MMLLVNINVQYIGCRYAHVNAFFNYVDEKPSGVIMLCVCEQFVKIICCFATYRSQNREEAIKLSV